MPTPNSKSKIENRNENENKIKFTIFDSDIYINKVIISFIIYNITHLLHHMIL